MLACLHPPSHGTYCLLPCLSTQHLPLPNDSTFVLLRSPLFMRSNDDNLVLEDQQQRLVLWSGLNPKERSLVLSKENCEGASDEDRAAACELLDQCLQRDPEQRPTMRTVLKLAFFSGRTTNTQILAVISETQATIMQNQVAFREDMGRFENKLNDLRTEFTKAKVCFLLYTVDCTYFENTMNFLAYRTRNCTL